MDQAEKPREHHYFFAHRLLPKIAFEDPARILRAFHSDAPARIFIDIWQDLGTRLNADIQPIALDVREHFLDALALTFGERRAVIVILPEPCRMCEAWYVGLVQHTADPGSAWRYLVLENSQPEPGEPPSAVLCEWFPGGSRSNSVEYIEPTLEGMQEMLWRALSWHRG